MKKEKLCQEINLQFKWKDQIPVRHVDKSINLKGNRLISLNFRVDPSREIKLTGLNSAAFCHFKILPAKNFQNSTCTSAEGSNGELFQSPRKIVETAKLANQIKKSFYIKSDQEGLILLIYACG